MSAWLTCRLCGRTDADVHPGLVERPESRRPVVTVSLDSIGSHDVPEQWVSVVRCSDHDACWLRRAAQP